MYKKYIYVERKKYHVNTKLTESTWRVFQTSDVYAVVSKVVFKLHVVDYLVSNGVVDEFLYQSRRLLHFHFA
jgi:hypothetical protein